jgi:hypothetical protein
MITAGIGGARAANTSHGGAAPTTTAQAKRNRQARILEPAIEFLNELVVVEFGRPLMFDE